MGLRRWTLFDIHTRWLWHVEDILILLKGKYDKRVQLRYIVDVQSHKVNSIQTTSWSKSLWRHLVMTLILWIWFIGLIHWDTWKVLNVWMYAWFIWCKIFTPKHQQDLLTPDLIQFSWILHLNIYDFILLENIYLENLVYKRFIHFKVVWNYYNYLRFLLLNLVNLYNQSHEWFTATGNPDIF